MSALASPCVWVLWRSRFRSALQQIGSTVSLWRCRPLSDRSACLLPYCLHCLHCVHCLYCLYRSYYNRDFMYLLKQTTEERKGREAPAAA